MLYLCRWCDDPEDPEDHESAVRIYEHLCEAFGREQIFDSQAGPVPGPAPAGHRDAAAQESEVVVVLVMPSWLRALASAPTRHRDEHAWRALETALRKRKPVLPVLVNGAAMPETGQLPPALQGFASRPFISFGPGRASSAQRALLVSSVEALLQRGAPSHPVASPMASSRREDVSMPRPAPPVIGRHPPAPTRSRGAPPILDDADVAADVSPTMLRPRKPDPSRTLNRARTGPPSPAPVPAPRTRSGMLGSLATGLRSLWRAKPTAAPAEPEPVLLAASAPRSSMPGAEFTAALVAYVEAARASAHKKLADLGEADDRRVDDIAATSWRVGAPVTVRLAGDGATVTPAEVRFDWSGRENLAAFSVKLGPDARDSVVLGFQVLVADVPVAFVPMRVGLADTKASTAPHRVEAALPNSAFASYSSRDAEIVTQRLSTLTRWAPALDIFQDCLDLTPGENFKPQLETQIAGRDVFILFWSRQAALSPWVRWEYTTALQRKGIGAILPMPLEDPAIAPPPPEIADQHQRDRFLLAGYALAKLREEAGGAGGKAP